MLEYRGYPIDQLAEKCSYLDVAYLVLHGDLPNKEQSKDWATNITMHTFVHENMKKLIDGFHYDAHPMGMLVSTLAALSTYYPNAKNVSDAKERQLNIYRLLAKVATLAAMAT